MTSTEYIARDVEAREELADAQALLNCSATYLTRIGVSEQAIAQARALVQASGSNHVATR
jgi:hypothetical protein